MILSSITKTDWIVFALIGYLVVVNLLVFAVGVKTIVNRHSVRRTPAKKRLRLVKGGLK